MQDKSSPIEDWDHERGHLYRRTWIWDDSLPVLGVIASHPAGAWEYDEDFMRAVSFAQAEHGGVTIAYPIPICGPAPATSGKYDRQRAGNTILAVMDEADIVVCAWGALPGGPELLQFISTEREHARLHHLGFKDAHPRRFSEMKSKTLTRWRE